MNDYPTSGTSAIYYYYDVNAAARNLEAKSSRLPQLTPSPMVNNNVSAAETNNTSSSSTSSHSLGEGLKIDLQNLRDASGPEAKETHKGIIRSHIEWEITCANGKEFFKQEIARLKKEPSKDFYDLIECLSSKNNRKTHECVSEEDVVKAINDIFNAKDDKGNTALHRAVSKGYLRWVILLLKVDADRSIRNNSGEMVDELAQALPKDDLIRLLLTPTPNSATKVLIKAVVADVGMEEVVRDLLSFPGVDVNYTNSTIRRALNTAALSGNVRLMGYLLDGGAEIDGVDEDGYGWTAVYYAAQSKNPVESIRFLRDRGANIRARNEYGSFLSIAKQYHNKDEKILSQLRSLYREGNIKK